MRGGGSPLRRGFAWGSLVLLGGIALVQDLRAQNQTAAESADTNGLSDSVAAPRPRIPQRNAFYLYPVPTSEKLTGFKVTLVAAYLWRTALEGTTHPSVLFEHSAYSAKHQLDIAVGGDFWTPHNSRNLNFLIEYSKSPAPFYGIGPRSLQSAEEFFTPRTFALGFTAEEQVRAHTFVQAGLRLLHMSVSEQASGGLLIGDTIPGSNGYTKIAPEIGIVFDSRDQLFNPQSGAIIEGHLRLNLPALGGTTGFQLYQISARIYRPVRVGAVLAMEAAFEGASGTVPFEELPQLGGNAARAYVYGRWRDRAALHGQAEWRQRLVWRLGAVAFAGAGVIGPGIWSLGSSPVRPTYGVGFRFNLSTKENANFSFDYARGQEGASSTSIGFAEAF